MKQLIRSLCPPLAWEAARRASGRAGRPPGPERFADAVGPNTDVTGSIEKRGKRSRVTIGSNCLIEGLLVLERDESRITIGNNVGVGGQTVLDCAASITIEDDVLISYQCVLADSDNHSTNRFLRRSDLAAWRIRDYDWSRPKCRPILIRRDAWIGLRCVILKGVTIGEGAVVGAGSVVTRDVPDFSVVAGNPARVVRELRPDERADPSAAAGEPSPCRDPQ